MFCVNIEQTTGLELHQLLDTCGIWTTVSLNWFVLYLQHSENWLQNCSLCQKKVVD